MKEETALLLDLVRRGSEKATVCTEPAMIAMAAAKARSLIMEPPIGIEAILSPGIMKNALAVGLPGTGQRGPEAAAALGAFAGNPDMGLEALCHIEPDAVLEANHLLDAGAVVASYSMEHKGIYCHLKMKGASKTAEITIEGGHSRISMMKVDGQVVSGSPEGVSADALSTETLREFPYDFLLDIVLSADTASLEYLREGALSALSLAKRRVDEGHMPFPATFCRPPEKDIAAKARSLVARAVYARMTGVPWPVLTSGGSGNQGISVGIPVLLAARSVGARPVQERRGLLLAHATNLYVKAFAGEISALCGAVTAGAGVAASVCWLMGGNNTQIEGAVQAVFANLCGMLCDGAKMSCALKCATAVTEGILAAEMALKGSFSQGTSGIVGCSLRETVGAIESLSWVMSQVDPIIIELAGKCAN